MNRPLNFSKDNLAIQWKYVKRNFQNMGILSEYIEEFQKRAHKAVEELIQGDIYQEFTEQIKAAKYFLSLVPRVSCLIRSD